MRFLFFEEKRNKILSHKFPDSMFIWLPQNRIFKEAGKSRETPFFVVFRGVTPPCQQKPPKMEKKAVCKISAHQGF